MEQIIQSLNSEIIYLNHTIIKNKLMIYGKIERTQVSCPYCKMVSSHVHSTYKRTFLDLPVSIYETTIILTIQKFFCVNGNCSYTTFTSPLSFVKNHARKTKRLEDKILSLSLEISSKNASKQLKKEKIDISKSTICRWIKKKKFE